MSGHAALYSNQCEVYGCVTNSSMLEYFTDLDRTGAIPTHVDVSSNYLGEKNVAAVCVVISTMAQVESVNFSSLDMQLHGITAVCDLCAKHRSITCVDLRKNEIFASGAKALLAMLKANPRITRCFFDADNMPERTARAIVRQVGVNIARAFPCTRDTCDAAANAIEVFEEDRSNEWRQRVSSAYQLAVIAEAEANQVVLHRCFMKAGVIACQVFCDFGPPGLDVFDSLLDDFVRHPADADPTHVACGIVCAEAEALMVRKDVSAATDGMLLAEQIDSLPTSIERCPNDAEAHVETIGHIRNSLVRCDFPCFAKVDDVIRKELAQLDRELVGTRRLAVLRNEAAYFLMDHPAMPDECLEHGYRACQRPIRQSFTNLLSELAFVARHEFSEGRRQLLSRWHDLCPPVIFKTLLRARIAQALDFQLGVAGTNVHGFAFGTTPVDWLQLVADSCESPVMLRALAQTCMFQQRYEAIITARTA